MTGEAPNQTAILGNFRESSSEVSTEGRQGPSLKSVDSRLRTADYLPRLIGGKPGEVSQEHYFALYPSKEPHRIVQVHPSGEGCGTISLRNAKRVVWLVPVPVAYASEEPCPALARLVSERLLHDITGDAVEPGEYRTSSVGIAVYC